MWPTEWTTYRFHIFVEANALLIDVEEKIAKIICTFKTSNVNRSKSWLSILPLEIIFAFDSRTLEVIFYNSDPSLRFVRPRRNKRYISAMENLRFELKEVLEEKEKSNTTILVDLLHHCHLKQHLPCALLLSFTSWWVENQEVGPSFRN